MTKKHASIVSSCWCFFSLLFPPTWHKNLFTFHFLMYTPPSLHSIGSILFEKKRKRKQKHRLSMAQKKTTRYTQWVPYRRFYTIWFVKKSLTTSKHCCIHITVYDVSPLLSLDCSSTTTKAFLIQCCVYLICSSVSFVIRKFVSFIFHYFFL